MLERESFYRYISYDSLGDFSIHFFNESGASNVTLEKKRNLTRNGEIPHFSTENLVKILSGNIVATC